MMQRVDTITEIEHEKRYSNLQKVMEVLRPAMQADGGDIHLVDADVTTGVVRVELTGACTTCAVAGITLQAGVERILRDRLNWVTEVVGGTAEPDEGIVGTGAWTPRSDASPVPGTVINSIGSKNLV